MTSRMSWHHSAMIVLQVSFSFVRKMAKRFAVQLNGNVMEFITVKILLMSLCQSVAAAPLTQGLFAKGMAWMCV